MQAVPPVDAATQAHAIRLRHSRLRCGVACRAVRWPSRATACRPSASSSIPPTSSTSTGSIPTRPRADASPRSARRAHDVRQLQRLHPEGRRRAGPRAPVRQPDGARPRRARRRLRPGRRNRPRWRPTAGRSPSAAPRGQVRRRHARHRRRRRLHLRHPEGEGPSALSRCRCATSSRRRRSIPHTVRYTFTGTLTRDLPLIVAGLPILSKAYYTTRRFDQTTLEPPLGSGPYEIGDSSRAPSSATSAATTIGPRTCPSTAAASTSTRCATSITATARVELEGFKAGAFDLREEFTSRDWATGYDVPAVKEGRLVRSRCPTRARPARKASSSTRARPSSPTRACARRSTTPSTSSGPTRTSSTGSTRAPRASSRTPT